MSSEIDAKIRRMMTDMPAAFKPEKAEGVDASIRYNLTGEGGSLWTSRLSAAGCTVVEGDDDIETPSLTVTMDASDYIDMMAGRLDAMQAFMLGKIKVQGDIMLATRMMSFFR
ncbi:MAG: SCP2 sterol-binding domain-containing protein [Caldilineales bacterium]|nr:SCP2 sterol-binding domain-containing protein [Caldilineales bacterium]MCW5857326.1 SCP2 sterol-binding domain-containing protein [Caldilineales bacterium]